MDVTTLLALAATCAPLVHPDTTRALVATESSFNPHAIGVVAGSLTRQPRSLDEALSTAESLSAERRNFSLGLAQINVHNLERLGLTMAEAFDACKNLSAMQTVLGECFDRERGDTQVALRHALSCYYSGNATTGIRHGYVSRVVSNAQKTTRAPR